MLNNQLVSRALDMLTKYTVVEGLMKTIIRCWRRNN